MKYKYEIKEVDKQIALSIIQKYHYSNTLPKLNKKFIGFYLDDDLSWRVKNKKTGKWEESVIPSYTTDMNQTINKVVLDTWGYNL